VSAQKRILLVEDEALIALSEKRCLEAAGHVVETVGSGEAAVEVASPAEAATSTAGEAPFFDLILMDINLGGGMDGGEAARRIREAGGPPVVFLSSHAEPEVIAKTSVGPVLRGGQVMSLILVNRDVAARMKAGVMEDGAAGI